MELAIAVISHVVMVQYSQACSSSIFLLTPVIIIIIITLFYSNRSSYRLRNKFTNQDIECVNYQNKCSNQSLEQAHKTIKTYVTNNHQKIPKCRSRDKSSSSSVSKQYNINNVRLYLIMLSIKMKLDYEPSPYHIWMIILCCALLGLVFCVAVLFSGRICFLFCGILK
jgi:hypothetical protein